MFTFVLEACALRIYPYKRISLLKDFGFGFLSGFVGGIRLSYPVRVWYALALASLLGLISTRIFVNFVLLSMLYPIRRLTQCRGQR